MRPFRYHGLYAMCWLERDLVVHWIVLWCFGAAVLLCCCAAGTIVQKREQFLDTMAELAGSFFPTAKGYKVVPQGDEFGGLLDGDED
jgi:hypothetical protein